MTKLFVALFLVYVGGQPFGQVQVGEATDHAACESIRQDPDALKAVVALIEPYANGQTIEVPASKCAAAE